MTRIPNPVPRIVGHDVPALGSAGWVGTAVAVAVATAHRQSFSVRHCVFLQLPDVDPFGM